MEDNIRGRRVLVRDFGGYGVEVNRRELRSMYSMLTPSAIVVSAAAAAPRRVMAVRG